MLDFLPLLGSPFAVLVALWWLKKFYEFSRFEMFVALFSPVLSMGLCLGMFLLIFIYGFKQQISGALLFVCLLIFEFSGAWLASVAALWFLRRKDEPLDIRKVLKVSSGLAVIYTVFVFVPVIIVFCIR